MRQMWLSLRERVSAIDELGMATTRLRLRLPDEEPTDPPLPNIIEPAEVSGLFLKLQNYKLIKSLLLGIKCVFKHVWYVIKQMWVIFIHLKLWVARHNFKWVKI